MRSNYIWPVFGFDLGKTWQQTQQQQQRRRQQRIVLLRDTSRRNMTMRTVKGSVKIREKQKIFKETGSPFDATSINSIKVKIGHAQPYS